MAETQIRRVDADVLRLAHDTIDAHHEHLTGATILWLFTTSKRTKDGHVLLGSRARSNPLQRYLTATSTRVSSTPADYIVLIDEGRWKRALAKQRAALIDHLCCGMIQKEHVNRRTGETTYTWGTIGPDVAEYAEIIRRHGIWLPAQQVFAKAVRETGRTMDIKFPDLEEDEEDKKAADNGKPPDRTTTVDDQGTVVQTERVANASPDAADVTASASGDAAAPDDALSPSGPPPSATNGHAGDWREEAGVGTSDLAVHRARRRGTASSEQPASS